MDATKRIYIFLVLVVVVVILIYAQGIIIPFILAILFWFMIRVTKKLLSKIKYLKNWPEWIFTVISSVILLGFLFLIVEMISLNIRQLSNTLPDYEKNVNMITQSVQDKFNMDLSSLMNDFTKELNFGEILSKI